VKHDFGMIQDHSVPCRVITWHFFPLGAEELEGSIFLKLLPSSTRHIFESLSIQYVPDNLRKEISHYATILKTSGYYVDQRFSVYVISQFSFTRHIVCSRVSA
jgi:hypothetical protein